MDKLLETISIQDCPICSGAGVLSEEGGWAFTVECVDCGAHTAISTYDKPEDRREAAERAAYTWNLGKVIAPGPGE